MNRPSRDVLAEVFPGVPLTREIGEFGTLLAIDRAKQASLAAERRQSREALVQARTAAARASEAAASEREERAQAQEAANEAQRRSAG